MRPSSKSIQRMIVSQTPLNDSSMTTQEATQISLAATLSKTGTLAVNRLTNTTRSRKASMGTSMRLVHTRLAARSTNTTRLRALRVHRKSQIIEITATELTTGASDQRLL